MNTKFTLKLDKQLIEKAKAYASSRNMSLSEIIASYLKTLVEKEKVPNKNDIEISLFLKSLKTGVDVPVDIDYKEEYRSYLAEKNNLSRD